MSMTPEEKLASIKGLLDTAFEYVPENPKTVEDMATTIYVLATACDFIESVLTN